MAKNHPVRHALEYAAARAVVAGLSLLPLGAAAWVGRRLGDVFRLIDGRHRRRVYAQAAERLGLSGGELDRFVKENFRHYGMVLAEFSHLAGLTDDDLCRTVDLGPLRECVKNLRAEGKGIIFITAHFGNWEWSNATARAFGAEGGCIARPLDNPYLNEYVRRIRERGGMRIFDKQGAIRKALGELRANRMAGILIDQDAGKAGVMSDFLGKPASTITVPIELAMRTGSPMLVVVLRRGGGERRFSMLFNPIPHRANPDAPVGEETRRLVDAVNADLCRLIMQAPEQWFWLHRRWKSVGEF